MYIACQCAFNKLKLRPQNIQVIKTTLKTVQPN